MPPKLREKYPNLPKYVTESNGRMVYRPRIALEDREIIATDKNGFLRPPVRLGAVGDPEEDIIAAYLRVKASHDRRRGAKKQNLRWIISEYMDSKAFKETASSSQRQAETFKRILDHSLTVNGKPTPLGDLPLQHISMPLVRRIREKRLKEYQEAGRKGIVMVNREITFLSTATSWGLEFLDKIGSINPFKIKKLKEEPSKRYVSDDEYELQIGLAKKVEPYLPIVFELTYLLASRGIETLDIKLSDIEPDRKKGGIYVHRRKGSKDNFIKWSDRLYEAYLAAKEVHAQFTVTNINAPLVLSTRGERLSKSGLDSAMQRLKRLMASEEYNLKHKYWSLHKLKHKGVTDAKDNRIAGHVSESIRNSYDHRIEQHEPAR